MNFCLLRYQFMSVLCLVLLSTHCIGQLIEINGSIVDAETKQPVSAASIYADQLQVGTISNADGNFTLKIPNQSDPVSVFVSHVGYATIRYDLDLTRSNHIISLSQEVQILNEVVVDLEPLRIAEEIKHILTRSTEEHGNLFYRQFTTIDGIAVEFIEAFYAVAYRTSGIQALKIEQARYARKKEETFRFTNFPYLTFGFPVGNTKKGRVNIPFSDAIDSFDFNIRSRFTKNDGDYVVLDCTPLRESTPADQDSLYLSATITYNLTARKIVSYEATLNHALGADDVTTYSSDTLTVSEPKYTWRVKFLDSDAVNSLEYAACEYTFKLNDGGVPKSVKVNSTAIIYARSKKQIKDLRKPDLEQEGFKSMANARYKPKFWRKKSFLHLKMVMHLVPTS
jgi:hypothetical protein